MKSAFQSIGNAFLSLIFPPICLSCKNSVESAQHWLCASCLSLLHLLDIQERCRICFNDMGSTNEKQICKGCLKNPSVFSGMAAAFEYSGPAALLVRGMKYSDQPYLAKGLAAYLVTQLVKLDWPLPDVIIPVPISKGHLLQRGYNQSLLLAQEVSILLNSTLDLSLARKSGDYSQAGLSKKQRMELKGDRFYLKPNTLQDKRILLIDDVMTTGTTLQHCGQTLLAAYPRSIYALTVCRTE